MQNSIFFIAGSSGQPFATSLGEHFQKDVFSSDLTYFKSGELKVCVPERALGETVVLVQSLAHPPHESFMELLLTADAIKRQGVKELILVIPYLIYNRQDRLSSPGSCLSAALVAKMIQTVSPVSMLTLDLHSPSTVGFFDFPVINILPLDFMAKDIQRRFKIEDVCIVSPDAGGMARARSVAKLLNTPMAVVDKGRSSTGEVTSHHLLGNVTGKTCLLIDDMIDTGGTLLAATQILEAEKAKEVHVYATHALFKEEAFKALVGSSIKSLTVTDTLPLNQGHSKIQTLESTPLFYPYLEKILGL